MTRIREESCGVGAPLYQKRKQGDAVRMMGHVIFEFFVSHEGTKFTQGFLDNRLLRVLCAFVRKLFTQIVKARNH